MQNEYYDSNADAIRSVIRYIERFHDAIVVVHIDDDVALSPLFPSHIRDISSLHKASLRTVIVCAARRRISAVLDEAAIRWRMVKGERVTEESAMPLVKMAAFDAATPVMTSLSANRLTAVIGNYVRARGKGVVDNVDYGSAGRVEKIDANAVNTVIASGFVPVFPCIGWSAAGRPYNISSVSLAVEVAVSLKAQKLLFLTAGERMVSTSFTIPEGLGKCAISNGERRIAAMDNIEVDTFIEANGGEGGTVHDRAFTLLKAAKDALTGGVGRVHILDGFMDGCVPCEVFSELGSGTMIYSTGYGTMRSVTIEDIPALLSLMRPFVESKRLLPRTGKEIMDSIADYVVYELDGGIRACAALHFYNDSSAEIAAVAVDASFSHLGIGEVLVKSLIDKARKEGVESVFILTTQAADWFERLGFKSTSISSLPPPRREKWDPLRGSRAYRLMLNTTKEDML